MALFLITGASGVGKTSIMNYTKQYVLRDRLGECVSHTTRPMRDGEVDGVTYYYIDPLKFKEMRDNDEFAEQVNYDGNLYGISKAEIDRVLSKYQHAYIIVEFEGFKQVKKAFPDAVGIFIHMSKEDCMANMLLRGDTMDKAQVRISTYEKEMMDRYVYDYVIKNIRGKQNEIVRILTGIVSQYEK